MVTSFMPLVKFQDFDSEVSIFRRLNKFQGNLKFSYDIFYSLNMAYIVLHFHSWALYWAYTLINL